MARRNRRGAMIAAIGLGLVGIAAPAGAETVLKAVMHSDLKIVDPIWTTAYITRNHGYNVYDTLVAMDAKGEIRPQMVDRWTVSDDSLTYTFTLRDGLTFHDGQPVTAEDAVASIKRWGTRDAMGVFMMSYVERLQAKDAKTFEIVLKKPFGLVLLALGKPSSNVPFVMPKRVAETPGTEQISDYTGSGPFVFRKDLWKPGNVAVYEKFKDYKPRNEPPSWGAGGKVAKVDRVEWISMPDHQTAVNALISGEIDLMEAPPHDLLPVLEAEQSVRLFDWNTLGNQYMFRFNSLHPPFNDPKIRRAALEALNQEDFLKAVIGDPRYYKTCAAMFVCGTTFATDKGGEVMLKSDFERSKQLLKEAGYDGTPVVLMHSTDLVVLANLAPVAKQLLEKGGFKVEMISMDWQSLVARRAKKDKPSEGGWSAFMTSWVAADILNPISTAGLNATGEKGWFGWFDDPKLEAMKRAFAEATDLATQKKLAEEIQVYVATEGTTHGWMGQWYQPMAIRKAVSGVLEGPVPYMWNIEKKG
ncbi:MAG: ABC transporter substrate-binding protein [Geminicoccaceae bacterium]|nr:ABC transporter substrate-binding protein [Geminicoccaceae bacterium]